MVTKKLFSQSCENNKAPIFDVLRHYFTNANRILEIGSGSGQHAVYFAEKLPQVFWQASDQHHYHASINSWIDAADITNIGRPAILDVLDKENWQALQVAQVDYDGVFSANTAHIMCWDAVVATFVGVSNLLQQGGYFVLYGPFNRNGEFTSESNAQFDSSLRQRDSKMGIRDDRDILLLANDNGLVCVADVVMPANNRVLVFQR